MAFVGAGGKTTAIFMAARELLTIQEHTTLNKTVLVTTTTHLGSWQAELADHFILIQTITDVAKLEENLPTGVVLLAGEKTYDRLSGCPADILEKIHIFAENHCLSLLIEADGSSSCPIKAPANHEPVIPDFSRNVIVMAGLMGLGKPLTKEWVHRPDIFAELSGLHLGDLISLESLVKVLSNKDGGLKNIPLTARRVMLLNQADTAALQSTGREISKQLISDYHSIIIASLGKDNKIVTPSKENISAQEGEIFAVNEQIAGIILAAGGSRRFGKPKQLLQWNGQPLIRHVVIAAMKAGLSPVEVVVGASAQEIVITLSDLPVRIVNNPDWMTGLSSSIRAGVSDLPKEVGGVIFLNADQPQISPVLVRSLIDAHQGTLGPIIAPQINGQRGNPVLFDIRTFPDLLSLKEDMGGRVLFSHYPVRWISWNDPNQLMDIDTPEDFQKFMNIYNN